MDFEREWIPKSYCQGGLLFVRLEAFDKGVLCGKAVMKVEIARRLKALGLTVSQIAKGTGLTRKEMQIENL